MKNYYAESHFYLLFSLYHDNECHWSECPCAECHGSMFSKKSNNFRHQFIFIKYLIFFIIWFLLNFLFSIVSKLDFLNKAKFPSFILGVEG